ncbi:MAG: hypothetical protein KDD66_18750 [Bdellovibrionales bacterium]|nr:hypothetical protein [Bdellovibrionales bacterium]
MYRVVFSYFSIFVFSFSAFLFSSQSIASAAPFGGLRCGFNNVSRDWPVEHIPAEGASAQEALANAQAACSAAAASKIADISNFLSKLSCPEECPNLSSRTSTEFACDPGGATATCSEDQVDNIRRFCEPFERAGILLEACVGFICSIKGYVARTAVHGGVSGGIFCG